MNDSIKLILILVLIILGNIMFYLFKPQNILISQENIIEKVKENIVNFEIQSNIIEVENIYINKFNSKNLEIIFNLKNKIEINTINDIKKENDIITLNNINILIKEDTNTNIDDNLNKLVKNKINTININSLINTNNIKDIYGFEFQNNMINLFYSEYNKQFANIMIYFSVGLQIIALIFGFKYILRHLYNRIYKIKG